MPYLRFANLNQHLMDTRGIEIIAVNMANLILYGKLDGCICRNKHLANGIATVLTSMDFEVFTKTDEVGNLYRVWIER